MKLQYSFCAWHGHRHKITETFQKKKKKKAHLHWQKPKSEKPGFFVVPFTLPEKPITFWFLGKKSACAKTPESHSFFFGKWCACATSVYL